MEHLRALMEWASQAPNANLLTALSAALGIPGAIWGGWLFLRWLKGRGVDARIDDIHAQNASIETETRNLREEFRRLIRGDLSESEASTDSHRRISSMQSHHADHPSPGLDEIEAIGREMLRNLPLPMRTLSAGLKVLARDYPHDRFLDTSS